MHTYTPAKSVFDDPITNLLSVLRILYISPFTYSCEGWESVNNVKVGTVIRHFPSDDTASMAVKGLKCLSVVQSFNLRQYIAASVIILPDYLSVDSSAHAALTRISSTTTTTTTTENLQLWQ